MTHHNAVEAVTTSSRIATAKKHTNRIFPHHWSGCSRSKGPRFSRTFHFRSTKARLTTSRGAVARMEARVTDRRARWSCSSPAGGVDRFAVALTRFIHDCEDTKSLFCYKHVMETV